MTKTKHMTRRAERNLAFQVLYGLSFSPTERIVDVRMAFWQSPDNAYMASDDQEGQPQDRSVEPQGFAWEVVKGVWERRAALDAIITHYSHRWRVDRLGRIELTLLRISLFEMLYRDDVPAKVAINEALELMRQFGDANARSFLNGILDAMAKAWENNELVAP